MVLHEGASSKRIDVIFDVYRENSIKNTQREHRGAEYGNGFTNLQPDHKVDQWRKFLLNPQNKNALTIFVTKEWKQDKYRTKLTGKVLFVACEEECHQISPEAAFTFEELNSTQEEADTRILLHLSCSQIGLQHIDCGIRRYRCLHSLCVIQAFNSVVNIFQVWNTNKS